MEDISALLEVAAEKNLISIWYQPIQCLNSGVIDSVEALMRLRRPDGSDVPPELFIPIAERTGQIVELGLWAIRRVCSDLVVAGSVATVSVNVSPIQLKTPGFAGSVKAILSDCGVSGGRLAFEITEGQKLEVQPGILNCLDDLRQLGIAFWLDDFGTGYAGLTLLRAIDFDVVKIDRSFLHATTSERGYVMLRNLVKLVRDHGPRVLLEGIEHADHLRLARTLGVCKAQGFHIGLPSPWDRLTAWPNGSAVAAKASRRTPSI